MSCFNLDWPAVNSDKIYLLSILLASLFPPSISSCNFYPSFFFLLVSPLSAGMCRCWYVLIVVILLSQCAVHCWETAPWSDRYVCHMYEADMILFIKNPI